MMSNSAKDTKKRQSKSQAVKNLEQHAFKKSKKDTPSVPEYAIPKPKYTDKTSNGLTKCVIDMITFCGYQAERINSTGRALDQRQKSSLGTIGDVKWIKGSSKNGTADISATIKGRSVKIEIKCRASGDRYQSKAQQTYQKEVEAAGGIYIVVRDFEWFYNWLKEFLTT